VVDASGIAFKSGWVARTERSFKDVRNIKRFDSFPSRVGTQERSSVFFSFEQGDYLLIAENGGRITSAEIERLAEYVSQRSGVEIERRGPPP
jgi:hypothetical protein